MRSRPKPTRPPSRAEQDYTCYRLRVSGLSFDQISRNYTWDHDGVKRPVFSTRSKAFEAFRREEARRLEESSDSRQTLMDRLDACIADTWALKSASPKVMSNIIACVRTQAVISGVTRTAGLDGSPAVLAQNIGAPSLQASYSDWRDRYSALQDASDIIEGEIVVEDD